MAHNADRHGRHFIEPSESRKELGDLNGLDDELAAIVSADKIGAVSVSDLQTRPSAETQGLDCVAVEVFRYECKEIAELFIVKFVPAPRH